MIKIFFDNKLLSLLANTFLLVVITVTQIQAVSITVSIPNVKNNNGVVRLALYRSAEGFPGDFQKSFYHESIPAKKDSLTFEVKNIPPGECAVAIIHDENSNDKLDTNFFGKPKEGYGSSNNTKRRFGPPEYEKAKVMLKSEHINLQIFLNY